MNIHGFARSGKRLQRPTASRTRRRRGHAAYCNAAGDDKNLGIGYLLASIAVVVIGGTSVAGGRANILGLWGAALFLVLLQVMLNTFGADAGVRLVTTGLVIIAVITGAGGAKALR